MMAVRSLPGHLAPAENGNKTEGAVAVMLGIFERQVLLCLLLAAAQATVSLIFWGRCAAWQWWAAVAAVIGVPFLNRREYRTSQDAMQPWESVYPQEARKWLRGQRKAA